jgi:Protein of unknown function (DUF1648)
MNRDWYKTLVWLMWFALPLTALNYWYAWDSLPMRMAVHFDINWQPNGYTTREGSLTLGLGIVAFLLVAFTISALVVYTLKRSAAWPVLAISYVMLIFACYGNYSIVKFNLNPQPARSELVGSHSPATNDSNVSTVFSVSSQRLHS